MRVDVTVEVTVRVHMKLMVKMRLKVEPEGRGVPLHGIRSCESLATEVPHHRELLFACRHPVRAEKRKSSRAF